ncbi:unnamed protein product [Caenorhabditis angaria]|uniref:Uncharacterized protein n=1 Tax=Caenorhabditis angaria TaxID=860376 RepID=A0A9P1MZ87_9PELO|nr:unnamed protein product [Caenorhabditis angaria]
MSVTQPADSGGPSDQQQTLQVDQKLADMNHQIGSWAQLMEEENEEEQFIEVSADEDEGTDEIDGAGNGESSSRSPEKRKFVPDDPPFRVQVTNISINHNKEEIFYFFGGDSNIKTFSFRPEKARAEFEFHSKIGLLEALERNDTEFQASILKVFPLRNHMAGKISARQSSDYGSHDSHNRYNNQNQYGGGNRRYQNDNYRGSHYNSQSSLNSEKLPRNYDKNYRDNRYQQNHYGTLPAGGIHNDRKNYNNYRGGHQNNYHNDRNNFKAPRHPNYDRQNSGPVPHQYRDNRYENQGGPIQRSGSYQHSNNNSRNNDYQQRQPQSINARSRTESHSTNFDQFSRTSSRMSIDEAGVPKPIQRKVSANPFGDAKPVDTQTKLLEIEKRQAEKERAEKEAAKQSNLNLNENDEQQHQEQNTSSHNHTNSSNSRSSKKLKKTSSNSNQSQNDGERRPSFDQGALPGTVTIKKRETTDTDKQRDDECSTPPVDPYQYPPTNQDTSNDSTPPPPPPTTIIPQQQKTGGKPIRPNNKPYVPKGGILQKSATVGQIDQNQSQNDGENRRQKDGKFHRNYSGGHRRPSFSGSENGKPPTGNRGAIVPKKAGNSNSATQNRGAAPQKQRLASKNDSKKNEEVKSPPAEPISTAPEPPVETVKTAAPESQKVEENSKNSSTQAAAASPSTTNQKKKDKKKERKKELTHLQNNKFSALLNCPQ